MKSQELIDALSVARREAVNSEIKNAGSKLSKLYESKVKANEEYNKGEREFLFSKGSTYAIAQRNLVRQYFRSYVQECTHKTEETENVMLWYDTNKIDNKQPILDTKNRIESYCKTTYENYIKGKLDGKKKSKEEAAKEKAAKLELIAKLATLSVEELSELVNK
ncbi:MAG: hypothetical protein ACI4SO_07525 [Muribaculaceae bacterium]